MQRSFLKILFIFFIFIPIIFANSNTDDESSIQASGEAGHAGMILGADSFHNSNSNKKFFLTISPSLYLSFGKISMGFGLPLRISPDDWNLREEDFDDPLDYVNFIQFIQYAKRREPFYMRIGRLYNSQIGHGTVVYNYSNSILFDQFYIGLENEINANYGGFEFLSSKLFEDPIIGTRGNIRPFGFFLETPIISRIGFGVSYVVDIAAPYRILGPNNIPVTDEFGIVSNPTITPQLDEDGNIQSETDEVAILGLDVEVPLFENSFIDLVPYSDFNFITEEGNGIHYGFWTALKFSENKHRIDFRFELRNFERNYIPMYFNHYYEITKYDYLFGSRSMPIPKLLYLRNKQFLGDGDRIDGWFGRADYTLAKIMKLSAEYEDYQGDNNSNVYLGAYVPALKIVRFGAYYYKINFNDMDEIFEYDDKSLFLGSAEVKLLPYTFFVAVLTRTWEFDNDSGFSAQDVISFGIKIEAVF